MKSSSPVVEVTISLSNVIKNTVFPIDDEQIIPIQLIRPREKMVINNQKTLEPANNGKIIAEAEAKAQEIIEKARLEAERIRKQIEQEQQALALEKTQVLQEAEKLGYEAGFAQGEQAGYKQVTDLIEKARAIVKAAEDDYQQTIARADHTILAIGLAAAEKILHAELDAHPERFHSLVQDAIKEAAKYQTIYVHVHPELYPILVEKKDELMPRYFHLKQLYIYPDEKLEPTDCIIETEGERIVAGVDAQLAELKTKLFELISRDTDESS